MIDQTLYDGGQIDASYDVDGQQKHSLVSIYYIEINFHLLLQEKKMTYQR